MSTQSWTDSVYCSDSFCAKTTQHSGIFILKIISVIFFILFAKNNFGSCSSHSSDNFLISVLCLWHTLTMMVQIYKKQWCWNNKSSNATMIQISTWKSVCSYLWGCRTWDV